LITTIRIRVLPNARADEIAGERAGAVKVRLRAPAVEGKANAALVAFLATALQVPRRAVTLERGMKSREKLVRVEGVEEDEIRRRLRFP